MKVEAECFPCLLNRGVKEAERLTQDPALLLDLTRRLLTLLVERFDPDAVPAQIGTLRDRLIRGRLEGDPYRELKKAANELALRLLPRLEQYVRSGTTAYERFRRGVVVAVLGNAIEFDIAGYDFNLDSLELRPEGALLAVDDTAQAFEKLSRSTKVLYLTDNAGEIVLDRPLIDLLRGELGLEVVVAVKGMAVLNDATLEDALSIGLDPSGGQLITTGGDGVGFTLEGASEEARRHFAEADFVVSKGMGGYETLSEYKGRTGKATLFLLKAKCNPVARSLGVPRGSAVAFLGEV